VPVTVAVQVIFVPFLKDDLVHDMVTCMDALAMVSLAVPELSWLLVSPE
jgi:hypothetical protein